MNSEDLPLNCRIIKTSRDLLTVLEKRAKSALHQYENYHCLLPNHINLISRVVIETELEGNRFDQKLRSTDFRFLRDLISTQFPGENQDKFFVYKDRRLKGALISQYYTVKERYLKQGLALTQSRRLKADDRGTKSRKTNSKNVGERSGEQQRSSATSAVPLTEPEIPHSSAPANERNCVACDLKPGSLKLSASKFMTQILLVLTGLPVSGSSSVCDLCQEKLTTCYDLRRRCIEIDSLYNKSTNDVQHDEESFFNGTFVGPSSVFLKQETPFNISDVSDEEFAEYEELQEDKEDE